MSLNSDKKVGEKMKRWMLLVTVAVTLALDCDRYDCKSNWVEWPEGYCGFFNDTSQVWHFNNTCGSGEICKQSSSSLYSNYTCSAVVPTIIYPGSRCGSGFLCTNDPSCPSGAICPGQSHNESCLGLDKYCDPMYYCASNYTCQRQKPEGSDCTSDSECELHLGCRLDPYSESIIGKCTAYFSLDVKAVVHPSNYDKNQFRSNFCPYLSAFETNDGSIKCSYPVSLNNSNPYSCYSDNDCESFPSDLNHTVVSSKCTCGNNPDGDSFCNLFPGDSYYFDALNRLKKWIGTQIYMYYCSEAERLIIGTCAMNFWNEADYVKASYYNMRALLYPLVHDSPDCVVEALYPDYYEIMQRFNNLTETEEIY